MAEGRASRGRALGHEARQTLHPKPRPRTPDPVASYVHAFNLYWYARPYAATALLAVYDDDGPALYGVDPAGASHVSRDEGGQGAPARARARRPSRRPPPTPPPPTHQRYFGAAVGKGRQAARTEIERLDLKTITCADAVAALARILHAAHEGDKPFELEMAWVCDASGKKFGKVPADLVAAADAAARAALDESDMEDA